MSQTIPDAVRSSKAGSLAGALTRLGWAGFWLQVVFGAIPIIVMIYYFLFSRSTDQPPGGFPFIEYLTIADLAFLGFTMFWSYRYTKLAKRLTGPEPRPSESYVVRTVWTGVTASAAGMLFSMIVMLIEAANLLFYFLKSPQAGIPVIQTSGTAAVHWVSSVDMVSLVALILTLFAELIVLFFSLWLLFRATPAFPEFSKG
ncbi:MAG TPA: DUF3611 family protein [Gemmataceae bacterium]|jgi:hypothetical protein